MSSEPLELFDGVELTATEFTSHRSDVQFFVAGGGVAFVTVNKKRRWALVPPEAGERYLAAKAARDATQATPSDDPTDGELHQLHDQRIPDEVLALQPAQTTASGGE